MIDPISGARLTKPHRRAWRGTPFGGGAIPRVGPGSVVGEVAVATLVLTRLLLPLLPFGLPGFHVLDADDGPVVLGQLHREAHPLFHGGEVGHPAADENLSFGGQVESPVHTL